jgi:hypothetical protein
MLDVFQVIQDAGMVPPPSLAHDALQNVDVLFGGTGVPLPSTVILDYIYGIIVYKAWRSKRGDGFDQMKAYRNEHYAHIPPPPRPSSPNDTDVTSGPDDRNDADFKPRPQKHHRSTKRSGLEETMDELNMFLMFIHGITPEMAAERNQNEIEREEQAAQEASRSKVMEWRNHLDVY